MREVFRSAESAGPRTAFVKNQLVYLMGRIDDSAATRNFLRNVWSSPGETQFVRYSAAFAATMLGEMSIEQEYYELLNSSPTDDEINRAYHLYYYGDIDLSSPWIKSRFDDATTDIDFACERVEPAGNAV